jgi:hypothetical protein
LDQGKKQAEVHKRRNGKQDTITHLVEMKKEFGRGVAIYHNKGTKTTLAHS